MKTKNEVSRSQKIREYLKSAKPSERNPKAVVEALKSQGVNVSAGLVSQVKNKLSGKKKPRIKAKAVRRKRRNPASSSSAFAHLVRAKDFLNAFGGDLSKAKASLDVISKLIS